MLESGVGKSKMVKRFRRGRPEGRCKVISSSYAVGQVRTGSDLWAMGRQERAWMQGKSWGRCGRSSIEPVTTRNVVLSHRALDYAARGPKAQELIPFVM